MYKTTERCNTQDKLVSALETIKSVKILNKDQFLGEEFCRNLEIETNGNKFVIEWYHNYSSIKSDFLQANFDGIVLNRPTYPLEIGSPLSLQLMLGDKTVVVI